MNGNMKGTGKEEKVMKRKKPNEHEMERRDRKSSPEHLQSCSQNEGRQHCPASHPLSSRVGSAGQCKPLPFFGRCYHCNKSNSIRRVTCGAEPSEPRG